MVTFNISEDWLMKFFVTRWLIIIGIAIVFGILARVLGGKAENRSDIKFSWGWWLLCLVISGMHAWTFHHSSFGDAHWSAWVGAGLMVGFGTSALFFVFARLFQLNRALPFALVASLSFPGGVWLVEDHLIHLLRSL